MDHRGSVMLGRLNSFVYPAASGQGNTPPRDSRQQQLLQSASAIPPSPATAALGFSSGAGVSGSGADDGVKKTVKLPSTVPETVKGERPYYHECYFKHCTTIIAMKEATVVTENLLNASAALYAKLITTQLSAEPIAAPHAEDAPPCGALFAWNELFQRNANPASVKPLRFASAWEERQQLVRRFQESLMATCEQAVYCAQRLFRGRQPVPADLIPIEGTTSFISSTFGALIHVWYSNTEAKKFLASQLTVAERLAALRLGSIFAPASVSFTINTFTVTATPLMPICTARRVSVDAPLIQRQLRQLEVFTRSRSAMQLHLGGDGRWYVVDCAPVLRVESESQGETNNSARSLLFDVFPNMDDFPETLRKAGRRLCDAVLTELFDSVQRIADQNGGGGAASVKVHELVAARTFSSCCHSYGFKICYAYDLLEHPRLNSNNNSSNSGGPQQLLGSTGSNAATAMAGVIKELIAAEMVCRTFKEIVRSELATMRTIPHADAPIPVVGQFLVEVCNRCVFNLLTKDELWLPHVMGILRIKFATPEQFTIPQAAVTKRTVLGYLTAKMGLVFESGRYCRTSNHVGASSVPLPTSVHALLIKGKQNDAVALAQQQWKRAAEISNPDLMTVSCRSAMHTFSLCGAETDFESAVATIDAKLDERSADLVTRGDMMAAFLDATIEFLPARGAACRKLITDYGKRYGTKLTGVPKEQDIPVAIYRQLLIMRAVTALGASGAEFTATGSSNNNNNNNNTYTSGEVAAVRSPTTGLPSAAVGTLLSRKASVVVPSSNAALQPSTSQALQPSTSQALLEASPSGLIGEAVVEAPLVASASASQGPPASVPDQSLSVDPPPALLSPAVAAPALLSTTAVVSRVSQADECDDLRVAIVDLWRRLSPPYDSAAAAATSSTLQSSASSISVHPAVMREDVFDMLCAALAQLFLKEGQTNLCASLLWDVAQAKSTRARYERLALCLMYCSLHSIGQTAILPANRIDFFRDLSLESLNIHRLLYAETDVPYFVALLVYVCHELVLRKSEMSMRQGIECDNFIANVTNILVQYHGAASGVLLVSADDSGGNTNLSETEAREENHRRLWQLLKSDAALAAVAQITMLLMDIGVWGLAKQLLAYSHHVVCEGKVDGYARVTQPAHPAFKEPAATIRAAMVVIQRFQDSIKRAMKAKKDERSRVLAAARKREESGFNRASLMGKPVPATLAHYCAKECLELAVRPDGTFMPRIRALTDFGVAVGTSTSSSGAAPPVLRGLCALLSVAPAKTTPNLCCVTLQSGYFPPFRFTVVPFAYGHRHIVIVPDTQCLGLWWSKLWLAPSRFLDSGVNVPLYAKIAAQYVQSQLRLSHLYFSIVGFGFCGPIAQCLLALMPAAEAQVLVTFGSPACFSSSKSVPVKCVQVHYALEEDIVPHLLGCPLLAHHRHKVLARLEGCGTLLPFPPSKKQMLSMGLLGYFGEQMVTLKANGSERTVVDDPDAFAKALDLRVQIPGLLPIHYVDALERYCKQHKDELGSEPPLQLSVFAVAGTVLEKHKGHGGGGQLRLWYPAHDGAAQILATELSADGTASDKLRSQLRIPSGVEPNVLTAELMTLTYPRIVYRILKGVTPLTEEYGFDCDGRSNATAIDRLLKVRSYDHLVAAIHSYSASSWYPDFLATQLVEWSGVTQGLQRQALAAPLVESFIHKNSFLFNMCPETSKGGDTGGIVDRLAKHLSEDDKMKLATALGYHVGWSIAVARTLPSVDTSRIIAALQGATCQSNGVSDVHPRTGVKNLFAPAMRFAFSPPQPKVLGNKSSAANASSSSRSPWIVVQWNLVEMLFDGSNASQTVLRGAQQCLWVVQDEYTFQHFTGAVDLSEPSAMKQVVVYCQPPPRAAAAAAADEGGGGGGGDGGAGVAAMAALAAHEAGGDSGGGGGGGGTPFSLTAGSQQQQPVSGRSVGGHRMSMLGASSVGMSMNGTTVASSSAAPSIPVATKVKSFCEAHRIPFLELKLTDNGESAAQLLLLLLKEESANLKNPVNPSLLPRGVNVGALYRHDDEEVMRHIKKGMSLFVKPNTPPGGGGGRLALGGVSGGAGGDGDERGIGRRGGGSHHVANVMSLKPKDNGGVSTSGRRKP